MKIVLNGRFGGTDKIDQMFRPIIIELRKRINKEFESENLEKNLYIQYFILINGNIVKYYDISGIYKTQFFQKKNEISLDLCVADIPPSISYGQALDKIKTLFMDSIEKISEIEKKKDLNFHIDIINESFEKIFNSMIR